MSEDRRARGTAALLVLLAITGFAAAAITITNITEWYIEARRPPIVKVVGRSLLNTSYIYNEVYSVTYRDGTNRTVIILTAFTGDPTEYEEVIKICNKDNVPYNVRLVYHGLLNGYDWSYVRYATIWLGEKNNSLELTDVDEGAATGWVYLGGGDCASVGIRILVRADAPYNQTIVGFQIDVEAQTRP